jgi:NAD(P)-dependent dehydrogenase (short-subunit alcohol dehydrogenase family)
MPPEQATVVARGTEAGLSLVIGASGALGAAICAEISSTMGSTMGPAMGPAVDTPSSPPSSLPSEAHHHATSGVLALSRRSSPPLDYADEATVAQAAQWVADQCAAQGLPLRTLVVATGMLHGEVGQPERSWTQLDGDYLRQVFLVNAIGPALVIKHFFPLLPKTGHVQAAFISAKVGSIGDNALGGWYGYRASKAALNQLVRTAAIELTRRNKASVCVALHPGTVASALSEPFSKTGLHVRPASVAAAELVAVLEQRLPSDTGQFFDYQGKLLPW